MLSHRPLEPGLQSFLHPGNGADVGRDLLGDGGEIGILLLQLEKVMELGFINLLLGSYSLVGVFPNLKEKSWLRSGGDFSLLVFLLREPHSHTHQAGPHISQEQSLQP